MKKKKEKNEKPEGAGGSTEDLRGLLSATAAAAATAAAFIRFLQETQGKIPREGLTNGFSYSFFSFSVGSSGSACPPALLDVVV